MKLLDKAPAPALPFAGETYQRQYQDQFNNVLRLYFNRLSGAVNAVIGVDGGVNIQAPHAMLMSNQDQASAGTTSENLVSYNTPVITQSVRVENGTEIWFDYPGDYLVTFSLQFTNRGNASQVIEVWAKDSGNNYPLSNTRFDIAARKSLSDWSHAVAAVSGIFTVDDPSARYLSIAWWSDGADVFLENYPEGTSPARPAIPSVILTASLVSRLEAS